MVRAGGAYALGGSAALYAVLAIGLMVGAGVVAVTQPVTWLNVLMMVVLAGSGIAFAYVALLYVRALQRREPFSISHEGSELIISDHLGTFRLKADDIEAYAVASRVKLQLNSDMGLRDGGPFTALKHKRLTIAPMFIEGDVPALLKQFDPQFEQKHTFTIEGFLDRFH